MSFFWDGSIWCKQWVGLRAEWISFLLALSTMSAALCNLLSEHQYRFREKYSTYMALLDIIDEISESVDKHFSICVFLDLSKAFNTIDHQILLNKLNIYGMWGVALK